MMELEQLLAAELPGPRATRCPATRCPAPPRAEAPGRWRSAAVQKWAVEGGTLLLSGPTIELIFEPDEAADRAPPPSEEPLR
eukprot:SAG11_NODE_8122_length_1058_cov_1.642336_1_plen_82_part_00